MAEKKIVYSEPAGYFPADVLKQIEKELKDNAEKSEEKSSKETEKLSQ